MKTSWAVNRPVTPREMETLAILARSAGCMCTDTYIKSQEKLRYACFLHNYLFHVVNPHPETHKVRRIDVPDITYEEAIEFFKEKIKTREV